MGTISTNKLAGLTMIIGPALGVLIWLVVGIAMGGSTNPVDFQAQADSLTGGKALAFTIAMLSIITTVFGWGVVQKSTSVDGVGEALTRLGFLFYLFQVIAGTVFIGATIAASWQGSAGANTIAVGFGVNVLGGILGGIGIILFAMGLSARNEYNSIMAYIVSIAWVLGIVFSALIILDKNQAELSQIVITIAFIITAIWSITVGRVIMNKE